MALNPEPRENWYVCITRPASGDRTIEITIVNMSIQKKNPELRRNYLSTHPFQLSDSTSRRRLSSQLVPVICDL